MELIEALITSLIMTLVLEIVFFWLSGKRDKKDLLLLNMVNLITNPPVVLLYRLASVYTGWHTYIIQIPLELIAVLVEGRYFSKYGRGFKHPYLFAVFANAFSYITGILLFTPVIALADVISYERYFTTRVLPKFAIALVSILLIAGTCALTRFFRNRKK